MDEATASFLLDADGNRMVLRLNGTDSLLPGANRSSEFHIWQTASDQGIAPPLLYVDEHNGFLVSTYINNNMPANPQVYKTVVNQALELLHRCHQLDIETPSIDYSSHIEHYWQIIETKSHLLNPGLNEQREPMALVLDAFLNSDTPTGLCHHDPVIANFVGNTDRLYLIDWE